MNKAVFKAPTRRFIKGQINGSAILLIVATIVGIYGFFVLKQV